MTNNYKRLGTAVIKINRSSELECASQHSSLLKTPYGADSIIGRIGARRSIRTYFIAACGICKK